MEWSDWLEEACEEWHTLTEEERAWELSDWLETTGINREVLCSDIKGPPYKSALDALVHILLDEGSDKRLNPDKLLFTHFSCIGVSRKETGFYLLLSNKRV